MLFNTKAIVAGAITGFITAFLVDIHAWADTEGSAYNWRKAIKRWIGGAVAGAASGAGLSGAL